MSDEATTPDLRFPDLAMSEESTTPDSVEIRRFMDAASRGDIDVLMGFFAPDAVWVGSLSGMGRREGAAAIRSFLEDWIGTFEDFEIETEEVHDLGNGVTLSASLQKGRPVGSTGMFNSDMRSSPCGWRARSSGSRPTPTSTRPALPPNALQRSGGRVMSENLDLVRSLYAKTERGDFSFVDREPELRDFYAPDFEWHTREDLPDAGVRRGYEGLGRLRAEWAEAFDDLHLDLDELIDAGDHVVAVARICGCLRGSGHQLEVEETQVWKMGDGRATEVRAYLTRSEALKAVGLEG